MCTFVILTALFVVAALQDYSRCYNNSLMTKDVRDKFLKHHNYARTLVAWGEAQDKKGGFVPQASRMPKLKYNCKIEASARNHAKQCKFEPSQKAKSKKLGENLAQLTYTKLDLVHATNMSVALWFSELRTIGVGKQLKFTKSLETSGVGNYTQLVWQRTTEFGCGVAKCGRENSMNKILVVCQYKRPGNIINQKIYDAGPTCSACPSRECERGLCI